MEKKFIGVLKMFIDELHSLVPTSETEKLISIFDKLNTDKITKRVYDSLVTIKDEIYSKNPIIFTKPLLILPNIDLSSIWNKIDDDAKGRMWIFLQLLHIPSCSVCDIENFNPYMGVEGGNISINDICNEIKSNPTFNGYKDGPNMNMFVSKILGSMGFDMNKLMEGLNEGIKELTDDNIKSASDTIINQFGISDPNTVNLFNKMFTSVAKQIRTEDLSNEKGIDGFIDVFSKITSNVFEEVIKPEIDSGKINVEEISKAQQNMFNSINNNITDKSIINPIELLNKMQNDQEKKETESKPVKKHRKRRHK